MEGHNSVLILIVTFIIFDLLGQCLASSKRNTDDNDNQRLLSIPDKVDVIDNKLDSQHNLMTRIEQRLDKSDEKRDDLTAQGDLTAPQSLVNTASGSELKAEAADQETEGAQEEYPYYHSVNLISVERNPTSEGNRFTVKFTKNAPEIFYRYHDDDVDGGKYPDSVVIDDGDVWSVSFTCGNPTKHSLFGDQIFFVIGDKIVEEGWSYAQTRHVMSMRLNNSEWSHSFQEVQALPELHVDPPRVAVYEPGQDFNASAFIPLSTVNYPDQPYISESVDGINMSDGNIYMVMEKSKIINVLREETDTEKIMESVTVLTSSTTVSGYLSFNIGIDIEGPLISTVQIDRLIAIHPSNQPTTLPTNFLGIMKMPYDQVSKNGNEMTQCWVGRECKVTCVGAGDQISDMEVVEVLSGGNYAAVPSAYQPDLSMELDTVRAVSWTFQAEEDSGDSDGITTFQCSASDETRDKEVTKLVDVLVTLETGIDGERSNTTVHDNPVDPHIKHITFNCAVYGRPLPEVRFNGGSSWTLNMDSSKPESFVETGQIRAVATKNLTLDLDYIRNYLKDFKISDIEELPCCEIWSMTEGRIKHVFELPSDELEK